MKKIISAYVFCAALAGSPSVFAQGVWDGSASNLDPEATISLPQSATLVAIGGSATNTELKSVRCKNVRTGKNVLIKIPKGSTSWDCAAAGLKVKPGDRVREVLIGQAPVVDTPIQISPPNESLFDDYPRTATLKWGPVTNADSYTVEIDCFQCCVANQWCTDVGKVWSVIPDIKITEHTFDFVGAQPGRWRVWAVNAEGKESAKTGWWDFIFLR